MGKPNAVVIPFPSQGHVIPLLEFSHHLIEQGFHVTFVNTESSHLRITAAPLAEQVGQPDEIKMVAIPDGMEPEEDRKHYGKLCDSILTSMPIYLEELVCNLNESEADRVTCIVADATMGWAVDVARKVGIPVVALWTSAAGTNVLMDRVLELIEDGIMDANGSVANHQIMELSPAIPPLKTKDYVWLCLPEEMQQSVFNYCVSTSNSAKKADYYFCNSFHEIEQAAYKQAPYLLPVGPLLPASRAGQPLGHFWPEDSTCLDWLDQQPARTVVYVAFGSSTVLDQRQFHELALGLEVSGMPFLWVVRPDLMDGSNGAYPESFEVRVSGRGRMVSWAPQQKVLAHTSVACFMSHCGWNSTMEGVANGVPFICCPYIGDQFFNRSYICDVWKIGLGLDSDEDGFITREEVKTKVKALLSDDGIRARVMELKEAARRSVDGGTSKKNFDGFIKGLLH